MGGAYLGVVVLLHSYGPATDRVSKHVVVGNKGLTSMGLGSVSLTIVKRFPETLNLIALFWFDDVISGPMMSFLVDRECHPAMVIV